MHVYYHKYQETLNNWCKGEALDPAHAILLAGVAEDVSKSQIEELMQTCVLLGPGKSKRKSTLLKQEECWFCVNVGKRQTHRSFHLK